MLNDVTIDHFEDRSQLVRLRDTDTVQTAHCAVEKRAVLYYTSWWDFVGIEFEIGGINPNCRHPKPRPSTPCDFFDLIYFLYQKGNLGSDHFKTRPNVIQPMFFIKCSVSFVICGMCGKVKVDH